LKRSTCDDGCGGGLHSTACAFADDYLPLDVCECGHTLEVHEEDGCCAANGGLIKKGTTRSTPLGTWASDRCPCTAFVLDGGQA
jgi:hypothetical protein